MGQIEATEHGEQRQDLQRELERLVARMEEKGAQITKLRKHQQTVCKQSGRTRCMFLKLLNRTTYYFVEVLL